MKQFLTTALLFAIMLSGCQKAGDVTQQAQAADPVKTPELTTPKPIASFKITNPYNESGDLLELRTLAFNNTSTNADSYSWDLSTSANYSDGNVDYPMQFSDKAEPAGIYIAPCMQTITIKLTAKNKAGDSSTYSQSFAVQCFRGVPGGGKHPVMHKLY